MTAKEKPPLEDLYLEHFGVKGMRWGVRKSRNSNDSSSSNGRTKKVVAGVATVAVGAAAATYFLSRRGSVPAASIMPQSVSPGKRNYTFRTEPGRFRGDNVLSRLTSPRYEADIKVGNSKIKKMMTRFGRMTPEEVVRANRVTSYDHL